MIGRVAAAAGIVVGLAVVCGAADDPRPNILWISAEDLSAETLGCYGGPARTPRIDALAASGLRFTAAFAAAPVCAPSRSAVITGMMPTSLGSLPMRCRATPPRHVVGFPRLLRQAGSFCTNNAKTDYNLTARFDAGWHASDRRAHWRNRPDPAQPFFAVFNLGITHESQLFGDTPRTTSESLPRAHRAVPDGVVVPPYYPDTPTVRQSLAWRLDLAAALDRDVGRILDELEADGLADSTIVVFWADHGEGVPHGKRALTEHGLRVPLVVRVPERFVSRLRLPDGGPPRGTCATPVSLLDLGPTMLDLAGVAIPDWMEGRSILGPHAMAVEPVVSAADRMDDMPGFGRSIRDRRCRYVRNFLPWLDGDDLPDYAAGVPITGELRAARAAGTLPRGAAWFARTSRPREELYDVVADPAQIADLAADTTRLADLARLRKALRGWMRATRDTGILPESILRREAVRAGSEWGIFHPGGDHEPVAAERYESILAAAWDVAEPDGGERATDRIGSPDPAVRFWGVHALGWAAIRDQGTLPDRFADSLSDPDPAVRIAAAGWLCRHGDAVSRAALDLLVREANGNAAEVRLAAVAAIDQLGDRGRAAWEEVAAVEIGKDEEYAGRTIERIRRRLERSAP